MVDKFGYPDPHRDIPDGQFEATQGAAQEVPQQEISYDSLPRSSILNANFPKPTISDDVFMAAGSALMTRISIYTLLNALNQAIDEFIAEVSVPIDLAREFTDFNTIETAKTYLEYLGTDNIITADVYKYAITNKIPAITKIYERYCFYESGYTLKASTAPVAVILHKNEILSNAINSTDPLLYSSVTGLLNVMGKEVSTTNPSELLSVVHDTYKDHIENYGRGTELQTGAWPFGSTLISTNGMYSAYKSVANDNTLTANYLAPSGDFTYAITTDLYNFLDCKFGILQKLQEVRQFLMQLRQLLQLYANLEESIMNFLADPSVVYNNLLNRSMNIAISQWDSLLSSVLGQVMSLISTTTFSSDDPCVAAFGSATRSLLNQQIGKFGQSIDAQARRRLKALYRSLEYKKKAQNTNSKLREFGLRNTVIKAIDEFITRIDAMIDTITNPAKILAGIRSKLKGKPGVVDRVSDVIKDVSADSEIYQDMLNDYYVA